MRLNVVVEEREMNVEVPSYVVNEGDEFFDRMDQDMDGGVQMGKEWVENPDTQQRCQVAAERLATALDTDNQPTVTMMAGYILRRMPGVQEVRVATEGELQETEFIL
ncbi:MAG TPA: hypothetical protein VKA64_02010 [Gammaproteobacteria bacterium]|nr:hypothetical protein [Gammaproteobacteria bacterium]